MKNTAIRKTLAVLLVLAGVIGLLTGSYRVWRRIVRHNEDVRYYTLLETRVDSAAALRSTVLAGKEAYEKDSALLEEKQTAYDEALEQYNKDLAEYATTGAGIAMGQKKLEEGEAEYQSGKEQFEEGYAAYLEGKAQLEEAYAQLIAGREQLEAGRAAYEEAKAQVDESRAQVESLTELVATAETTVNDLETEIAELKSTMPKDEEALQARIDQLRDEYEQTGSANISEVIGDTYRIFVQTYDNAAAMLESMQASGKYDYSTIMAMVDSMTIAATGMTFENLGIWLSNNEPDQGDLEAADASIESIEEYLLNAELTDADYLALLELINTNSARLEALEAALAMAKPELEALRQQLDDATAQLDAAELELAAAKEQLDAGEAAIREGEPAVIQGLEQLDLAAPQMETAKEALDSAGEQIAQGKKELGETEITNSKLRAELKQRHRELVAAKEEIDALTASTAEYEYYDGRYTAARNVLLNCYEEIEQSYYSRNADPTDTGMAYLQLLKNLDSMGYRRDMLINCSLIAVPILLFTALALIKHSKNKKAAAKC